MRSNFIKELESCTVTFQGPFCKLYSYRNINVCCLEVGPCVHAGAPPRGTGTRSGRLIFHHANAAFVELAESVPSGGQRSVDWHAHPFQLKENSHRKAREIHSREPVPPISVGPPPPEEVSDPRLSFLLTWLAGVQRTSVPLESKAVSRLMASSLMRFENFP